MVLTFMMEGASLLSKTVHQGWVLVCPHWFQLVLALPFSTHLPFLLPALGFADCLPVSAIVCDQLLPPVIFSSETPNDAKMVFVCYSPLLVHLRASYILRLSRPLIFFCV